MTSKYYSLNANNRTSLWGNPSHFDYILQQIEQHKLSQPHESLTVYRTKINEGYRTLDGIDVCGLRVANEINEQIEQLRKEGVVTKISIVGYSLGGLIARFAIGILYHQGLFNEVEPVNFTTFCSPHVGVLTPGSNISVKIFNSLIPSLLSLSGKQMFLKDRFTDKGSLIGLMANKSSVFYKALDQFKYKSVYANAINDKRTSYWTTGISVIDPFLKIDETTPLDELDFTFIKEYEPIVIDSTAQFYIAKDQHYSSSYKQEEKEEETEIEIESHFWRRKWNWVIVLVNLSIVAPLWIFWFILSSILESYKSRRRISSTMNSDNSSFFSLLSELNPINDIVNDGDSDILSIKSLDNIATFEKSLNDRTDYLLESVWDAMTSKDSEQSAKLAKYDLISPQIQPVEPKISNVDTLNLSTEETITGSINELSYFEKDSALSQIEALKVFTLDLTDEQLEIIKSLNDLGWKRYPILIRKTKSTHSASIVRNIDEVGLYEGKVVVNHWLEKVFKIE